MGDRVAGDDGSEVVLVQIHPVICTRSRIISNNNWITQNTCRRLMQDSSGAGSKHSMGVTRKHRLNLTFSPPKFHFFILFIFLLILSTIGHILEGSK